MANLDYESLFSEVLIQLQNDLGEEEFSGWFSDIKYLRHYEVSAGVNCVVAGVPSAFHCEKVKSRYQKVIESKLSTISGNAMKFELEIANKKTEKKESTVIQPIKTTETAAEKKQKSKEKRERHSLMRDDYTFERFVLGENNNFAANAAIAISKNPGKVYNPFLIYGDVGLGKTHLMQAIGNYVHENSDSRVIFITSENFLNEYIDGVQQGKMNLFKNKYRYTDVLLIDDIQFLTDKPGCQEELFHTFNALFDAKKQLVFTCDRQISELKKFHDRLISRLELGVKADLQPPRYEERCAILKSVAQARNVTIDNEVIDIMSKNISSNVRDLISALNNLIAYTELMGKPVTVDTAQRHLKNIFNTTRPTNLSMDNIIRVVAENFGLTPNDLKGRKKSQNVVFARQLAMYIGREMTDYSTTEIGQDFGGKDHTTVMHSIKIIKNKLITNPALEPTVDNLKRSIKEFSAKY